MLKQVQQDKRGAVPPDVIAGLDPAIQVYNIANCFTWTPHQVRRDMRGEERRRDGRDIGRRAPKRWEKEAKIDAETSSGRQAGEFRTTIEVFRTTVW